MVRLKDVVSYDLAGYDPRFNSTMVRLKVPQTSFRQSVLSMFQFHYGTIKRTGRINKFYPINMFQFHYGTIKSSF